MIAIKKYKKVLRKEIAIYENYIEKFEKEVNMHLDKHSNLVINWVYDGMETLNYDVRQMFEVIKNASPADILGEELFNKLKKDISLHEKKLNALSYSMECLKFYIRAFESDKIITPVYLGALLSILYGIYINNHLTIEEFSQILGMAIVCNGEESLKNDFEYCIPLLEYYNEDGTFKNNDNVDGYLKALTNLFSFLEEDWKRKYEENEIVVLEEIVPEIKEVSMLAYEEELDVYHFEKLIPLLGDLLKKSLKNNKEESMPSVARLKLHLKKCIVMLKKRLAEYRVSYKELQDSINEINYDWFFNVKGRLNLSFEQMNELVANINHRLIFGEEEYKLIMSEKSTLEYKLEALVAYIKFLQSIINSFEEDKVKNSLAIDDMLQVFLDAYCDGSFKIEEINKFLGMLVVCNAKTIDEKSSLYCKPFLEYYNEDGTFKLNKDINTFRNIIINLCDFASEEIRKKCEDEDMHAVCDVVPEVFKDSIFIEEDKKDLHEREFAFREMLLLVVDLLEKNNQLLENQSAKRNVNVQQKIIVVEELDKLRKYYRNKKLVAMPDDMDEFLGLLDRCGLDENEIKYILDLISEQREEDNKDNIAKYLDGNDLIVYEKAKKILESIRFTDSDYYMVVDSFLALEPICELLAETFDEDLMEEKKNIMLALNDFNNRHEKTEIISLNNLIFLDKDNSTYLAYDLDKLGTVPRNIGALLSKINKDNQRNFRRVITGSDLEYTPYEIFSNGISIFFVEVDAGIYVVIGCASVGSSYRKIINRVRGTQVLLKEIEETVKNPKIRNKLLTEQEKFLDIYSKVSGLKRKKV